MPAFDELLARYDAHGYVIIRDLFFAAEIDELNAQIERYIREIVPTLPQDAAFYDDYVRPETLRKMQSLDKPDAWFHQFMNEGKHVPLLEYLLRDTFSPQGLKWFTKLPYDRTATPAHQDGFCWYRKPNLACGDHVNAPSRREEDKPQALVAL